jgi:hypothetical protein
MPPKPMEPYQQPQTPLSPLLAKGLVLLRSIQFRFVQRRRSGAPKMARGLMYSNKMSFSES